ncbi:MAG: RDD family protein, partial [Rickettsiaceae bacterium]|nr:RDD family protein [Rickettsiaceae bacterium]
MIDLTIISFILRPIMGMISLYLIRYFFAPNIEMLGMTINSFEDVRLLTTSDDFAKSITPTQFLGLTFSTFAIEFILISVYFIFCWMKYGQTIGKYILKMKVVDLSDYQKISFTRSALRYFGYIFGLISIVMLFF